MLLSLHLHKDCSYASLLNLEKELIWLGDILQVNPSRDAYWKFGNTAVASTWYILARIESQGLIKKGDRLWQIGEHYLSTCIYSKLFTKGLSHL